MTVEMRAALLEDLAEFEIAPRQQALMPGWFAHLETAVRMGAAISAVHRGRVIAIGGVTPIWPGRATCWASISRDFPREAWVPVVRAVRRMLGHNPVRRIEADVHADFHPGRRLVQLLGFGFEGPMPAYWVDGSTFLRFARIAA